MISKIGVDDRNVNSLRLSTPKNNREMQSPSFKGGGVWSALLMGIQECEKNPMINVAVIDLFSAILPRTFVESLTNWFAGFEAFRRESSGLIVNCLIPGYITMGIAQLLNKFVMPKNTNLATCWADSTLIDKATQLYTQSQSDDKIKDSLKEILKDIQGVDGKKFVNFNKELTAEEIELYATKLKELASTNKTNNEIKKGVKAIANEIAQKTHVFENIQIGEGKNTVKASTVRTLLEDSVKYFREFQKAEGINIQEYANKSKKLVKSKSLLGLAVVLPLAASMQYINRWITGKISGVNGAPIYEDFGKTEEIETKQSDKKGLLKQKLISISSMVGVGLLSMMKMPSWNMLEFKGKFPTMDQARIISTTTFASRMAAADDKNELAESTVRDIATFFGLYFLGDYAAKIAATIIQNKTDVTLLNETQKLEENANMFKRFWHWVKHTNIKSSEEVISKTAEDLKLKKLQPNETQKETIAKELKKAINYRSACQVANLGVSLILLGLIIPIFTRKNTKKRHAEDLKLAQQNSSSGTERADKAPEIATQTA